MLPQSSPPAPILLLILSGMVTHYPSLPGTQSRRSPRSWAGNLMFRSVDRGVLISQSKTRAELLSQTCKGRSSLGNHMQIPCWGQWCGQSQRQGGRGQAQAKWSKALVCLDEYCQLKFILLATVGRRILLRKCRLTVRTQGTRPGALRKHWRPWHVDRCVQGQYSEGDHHLAFLPRWSR